MNTSQASGQGAAQVAPDAEGVRATSWKRIGSWIGGIAGVLGASFGWAQWQDWDVPGL